VKCDRLAIKIESSQLVHRAPGFDVLDSLCADQSHHGLHSAFRAATLLRPENAANRSEIVSRPHALSSLP